MRKLKYIIEDFRWLKILNSPFKPFSIKWYVGKTAVGVPYFFPRKTVKSKTKPGYLEFKPIKVGFDYCCLGWKTKWTNRDYRFEWSPVFTFVFFGYQIAMIISHKHPSHYWEAWLYYEYATDKTKSKRERVKQCRKEFNQTWRVSSQGKEEVVDYYELILKPKYLRS